MIQVTLGHQHIGTFSTPEAAFEYLKLAFDYDTILLAAPVPDLIAARKGDYVDHYRLRETSKAPSGSVVPFRKGGGA